MKTLPIFLLLSMWLLAQWGQAETDSPAPQTEGDFSRSKMEGDDFVARPIEEIEELFRQKQYQAVIDECERLIAYDPGRWEARWARLKLSECYTALGQLEKAGAILAEGEDEISHPREQAEVLMWQLRHAVGKRDLNNAYKLADELTTKFIGDYHALEAMEAIIESYLEDNRLDEARQRIDQMLKQYPFQDNLLWLAIHLGERYRDQGLHQQAILLFQEIQNSHSDRVEIFVQLAATYREMGNLDQAIEACNAAISTFPAHWEIVHVWSMMGDIHQQKDDLRGALKAFLTAGEFRGTDQAREALRRAEKLYQELGESDQAIELLTKLSVQGAPDSFDADILRDLASAYAEDFDYVRAESTLKNLVESYPQTHQAHEAMMQLLEMYWETNQREKAIDFFGYLLPNPSPYLRRQAIQRFIEVSHEEGMIAELEGRNKLSELAEMFRQAVAKAPNLAAALVPLRGLAVIAQWMENWEEVVKVNTRLIEDYDDLIITLEARERLAECYKAKGKFGQALDQVNRILAIAPEGPRAPSAMLRAAHYQLAQELEQSNALERLRELAEKYPNSEEGHRAREMLEQFGEDR